jgi:hypothetical protein
MKQYEYTYTVKSIDIIDSAILVEYKPVDANLTTVTLNLPGNIKNSDDTFMVVEELIKLYAPQGQWESQENLKSQYDTIIKMTNLVVPNA